MVITPSALLRRSAIALLAVATTVALLVVAPPAATARTTAVDNYGGCLVSQGSGDLLILVDESQSLQTADPDDARVRAAGYLITQLTQFSRQTGVDLDVLVAGFSSGYQESGGWHRLGQQTDAVNTEIDSYADREDGYQTDYWTGLDSARSALAAKAAEERAGDEGAGDEQAGDQQRCQAIVWFTDGRLDLDLTDVGNPTDEARQKPYAPEADLTTPAGVDSAEQAATEDLCRPGGIADQLRRSEVALFAIGLRSEATSASDFALMKSIATGSDDCGEITEPTPGDFVLASDIDDLLFAFDRLRDPSKDPTEQQTGICQGELCTEYRHNFVLDDSISSVHVLGSSQPGLDVYLVPPDGDPQRFRPGPAGSSSTIDAGGTGTVRWLSDRTMSIDLDRRGSWAGQWAVVFVDPDSDSADGTSRTNIHLSGDVYPTLRNANRIDFRSGEMIKGVRLGLLDGDDEPIAPTSLLGDVRLDATLVADGEQTVIGRGLGKNEIARPRSVDLRQLPPGRATLQLELAVRTAGTTDASGKRIPGTQLAPQQARIPITIAPPPGYPQLGGVVDFGAIEGPADQRASVAVSGPGCVWLPADNRPEVAAGPTGLGQVGLTSTADSADNCLRVADGETADLGLRLTTAEGGNGTLDGTVAVRIAPPDEPDRAQTVPLRFTADMDKPLNPVNFLLALIVALILGPGIPLGLLYLIKYLTAKIPPRALLGRRIPVQVQGDRLLRDGAEFALQPADLQQMVRLPISGARRAEAGGLSLRTRVGRSPFGAGFVQVESPGLVGASSAHDTPYGPDRSARLPLAVQNTWALLHDPSGSPSAASVLILLGADFSEDPARRQRYADDIAARAPGLLRRLRESVGAPAATESGPDDPFGTGDPSSTGGAAAAAGGDPFGLDRPGPVRNSADDAFGPATSTGSGDGFGSGDDEPGSGSEDRPGADRDPFDFGWSDEEPGGGDPNAPR